MLSQQYFNIITKYRPIQQNHGYKLFVKTPNKNPTVKKSQIPDPSKKFKLLCYTFYRLSGI